MYASPPKSAAASVASICAARSASEKGTGSAINSAPVLYSARRPDYAAHLQDVEKQLGAAGKYDASVGLYSATNQRSGVAIQFRFADGMIDIVAGRRPMSDFDALLREWKTGGGDTIVENNYFGGQGGGDQDLGSALGGGDGGFQSAGFGGGDAGGDFGGDLGDGGDDDWA